MIVLKNIKKMSKIPTAEEFLKSKDYNLGGNEELADGLLTNNVIEDMIEFAKLHVEAALKEASENAKILEKSDWGKWEDSENEKGNLEEKVSVKTNYYGHGDCSYQILTVSHESILKAYPLTNIK